MSWNQTPYLQWWTESSPEPILPCPDLMHLTNWSLWSNLTGNDSERFGRSGIISCVELECLSSAWICAGPFEHQDLPSSMATLPGPEGPAGHQSIPNLYSEFCTYPHQNLGNLPSKQEKHRRNREKHQAYLGSSKRPVSLWRLQQIQRHSSKWLSGDLIGSGAPGEESSDEELCNLLAKLMHTILRRSLCVTKSAVFDWPVGYFSIRDGSDVVQYTKSTTCKLHCTWLHVCDYIKLKHGNEAWTFNGNSSSAKHVELCWDYLRLLRKNAGLPLFFCACEELDPELYGPPGVLGL